MVAEGKPAEQDEKTTEDQNDQISDDDIEDEPIEDEADDENEVAEDDELNELEGMWILSGVTQPGGTSIGM